MAWRIVNWLGSQSPLTPKEDLSSPSGVFLKRPYSGAGRGQKFVYIIKDKHCQKLCFHSDVCYP